MKKRLYLILCLVITLSIPPLTAASAFFAPSNGQAATLVLGQPDFTSNNFIPPAGPGNMNTPSGVAVDPTTGKVFVADTLNNRVLRFPNVMALNDGDPAEAVFGQPDFTSHDAQTTRSGMQNPNGVAVDKSGRLWVADTANSRVLRFDNASGKASGADADGVLGQPDFSTTVCNIARSGLCYPNDVAVEPGGRLWVEDGANRVLRYDNAAAKTDGADADGVLGQPDFTSSAGQITQNGMADPHGVAVDASGRLWVADTEGNRVLRFDNAAAKPNGANADGVLGQPDFSSSVQNTTQSGMGLPLRVSVDASGRLYVADWYNSRVLIFSAAANLANGAKASSVLGQTNFFTNGNATSATTLASPVGLFYDRALNVLWVADGYNNRVLMYGVPDVRILPIFGLINFFLPPGTINTGTISIQTRDGSIRTLQVPADVRIRPPARAAQLGVGSYVNVIARFDPYANGWIAEQIIVLRAAPGVPSTPTSVNTQTATATSTPAGVPTSLPTDTPTATSTPTDTPPPTDTPTETPVGIPPSAP